MEFWVLCGLSLENIFLSLSVGAAMGGWIFSSGRGKVLLIDLRLFLRRRLTQ
jgi:hypothetical protein